MKSPPTGIPDSTFTSDKSETMKLTTQMYFPDEPLNEKDFILNNHEPKQQKRLIAKRSPDEPTTFEFRLVLEKAG